MKGWLEKGLERAITQAAVPLYFLTYGKNIPQHVDVKGNAAGFGVLSEEFFSPSENARVLM